jgi:ribose transport system permease protein
MKTDNTYESSLIQKYGAFVFLLAMVAGNCVFTNNFMQLSTLWLLVMQAFPIIIVGIGMTMVIASGGIDISVGAIMAFSGTLLAHMMVNLDVPLFVCVAACLVSAALLGAANGFIIAKFHIQPIVVTLVMMLVARGLAQLVTSGRPVPFSYMTLNKIANFRFWEKGMPIQFLIALIVVLAFALIFKKTVFGKQVQVMGDNFNAAGLIGIGTFGVTILIYSICGATAGLATIIEVGRESQAEAARMGINMELNAIAAAAVGGTPLTGGRAKAWGTVCGALIMQLVNMTVNMNGLLSSWGMVAKAVILIIAVYIGSDKSKA